MRDGTVEMNPGPLNPDIVRPVGPIDPEIGILLFERIADGKRFAALTSFATHTNTERGSDDPYRRRADFPFWARTVAT